MPLCGKLSLRAVQTPAPNACSKSRAGSLFKLVCLHVCPSGVRAHVAHDRRAAEAATSVLGISVHSAGMEAWDRRSQKTVLASTTLPSKPIAWYSAQLHALLMAWALAV